MAQVLDEVLVSVCMGHTHGATLAEIYVGGAMFRYENDSQRAGGWKSIETGEPAGGVAEKILNAFLVTHRDEMAVKPRHGRNVVDRPPRTG